jgi:hypothetical protein
MTAAVFKLGDQALLDGISLPLQAVVELLPEQIRIAREHVRFAFKRTGEGIQHRPLFGFGI